MRDLAPGGLPDETAVVYVSPLKALSNDIRLNLDAPLAGIRAELAALGLPDVDIRTAERTGDTPQRERQQSLRRPLHIPLLPIKLRSRASSTPSYGPRT